MNPRRLFLLAPAVALVVVLVTQAPPALAQSTLKASCADGARAFSLRQDGIDRAAVADPGASAKLRQAALLFYRCAQHETDSHTHQLFMAYYANTLYRVGETANDARASELALAAAQPLEASIHPDVRALVANVVAAAPTPSPSASPTPALSHSAAYCSELASAVGEALQGLDDALASAIDAGNNDTEALATTTARYGGAFKAVEDDFTAEKASIGRANSALGEADSVLAELNDQERSGAQTTLQVLGTAITYTDTYSRLALAFERGINGTNRRIARARIAQALAAGERNTSTTYTNGNANCYSYTAYSASCYGNSTSTTYSNDQATVAQENASNALAQAEAGRLSYGEADSVLTQGLPILQQIRTAVEAAEQSWGSACSRSR